MYTTTGVDFNWEQIQLKKDKGQQNEIITNALREETDNYVLEETQEGKLLNNND